MRAAPLLASLCLGLAGCAAPARDDAPCRPLALDLLATEAPVGQPLEMDVVLANCTGETQTYALDCTQPVPTVEVGGRTYHVSYGAATDPAPPCPTGLNALLEPLPPGQKRGWRLNWNGTIAGGCFDGDGCDPPVPAPGRHVLRVAFVGQTAEGSVEFR